MVFFTGVVCGAFGFIDSAVLEISTGAVVVVFVVAGAVADTAAGVVPPVVATVGAGVAAGVAAGFAEISTGVAGVGMGAGVAGVMLAVGFDVGTADVFSKDWISGFKNWSGESIRPCEVASCTSAGGAMGLPSSSNFRPETLVLRRTKPGSCGTR